MPTYPHIERYYEHLQQLLEYGGSSNEQSIRPAFLNCLTAYCGDHREKLVLVPELAAENNTYPDGTVKDTLRLPRGYWEAKDTNDNLDAEIQRKFNRGYPTDNIIFEDSREAVLMRQGTVSRRVDMRKPADLHGLILAFLNYVPPAVESFRQAWHQFKLDLPNILAALRVEVQTAADTNEGYRAASAAFLQLCHRTIGPSVSEEDVREMLLQHILTKDIFLRVFSEDQFHQENNVAKQLDHLERTFFVGDRRRQAIADLLPYYGAITSTASFISDYQEKQRFLKAVYEDFYKTYNPAAADRLGVVYTPEEVVDFIIRGTDHLLQKHFGRNLSDKRVQILDPAAGTGTFITSLINYLPEDQLEYKYRNEVHANEVAILPYYIANLNIEYSYKEKVGRYLEFPNLCFVDTLDNLGWQEQGATEGTVQRQRDMALGGISEENWIRVQEQNEKPISVIIGNPPYNDSAESWGDGTANREYPQMAIRIRETYFAESKAKKPHRDIYKMFLRWASDRLDDEGIIAFITNRSYLDARNDDGLRKTLSREFSHLYVVDLGGNHQSQGRAGNIFGIKIGVAIGFFVRKGPIGDGLSIHYLALNDDQSAEDKLSELKELHIQSASFDSIIPDANDNWLNQSNASFGRLLPLTAEGTESVSYLTCPGVKTDRDEWVYDIEDSRLREKVTFFAERYNSSLVSGGTTDANAIKWSNTLHSHFRKRERISIEESSIVSSLYRPFSVRHYLVNSVMSDRLTRNHFSMFGPHLTEYNKVICVKGPSAKNFSVLASSKVVNEKFVGTNDGGTFCLPLYRYTADGERVCNITDWGIRQFNDHYRQEWGDDFEVLAGPNGITAEDIFAYTYAVLHDPVYRHDYRIDLLREFPRLPFYPDFPTWKQMGQELLDLHIGFEGAEPYPLKRVEYEMMPSSGGRPILSADKKSGTIRLNERTTLTGVPPEAWEYLLGSRSALEWVLDQYKEKKIKDPTIAEKFNTYRFADYKEKVIDLLQRVCTVSVRTVEIVGRMAYWDGNDLVVSEDRDKREWETMALESFNSYYGESDDDPEYQAWLASLPDIREQAD